MRAKPHLRLKKVGARLLPDYYSPETVLPGIRDEATLARIEGTLSYVEAELDRRHPVRYRTGGRGHGCSLAAGCCGCAGG